MLLGVPERALAIFDSSSLMSAIEVTIPDENVGSFRQEDGFHGELHDAL